MSAAGKSIGDVSLAALGWFPGLRRRSAANPALPQPHGDAPAPMPDVGPTPGLGLRAVRRLLARVDGDAALVQLRALPHQGRCLAEKVALTMEAAPHDAELQQVIVTADAARDAADWPRAEGHYWRALGFYPLHAGYMVQYGHALKEQAKLVDAEVAYRSARALGAPAADVDEHLLHVQGMLGYAAPPPPVAVVAPAAHPLDRPPTRTDIETLFALLLHRPPEGMAEILELLRRHHSCREVALDLVRRDAFRPANRELLILLAEQP